MSKAGVGARYLCDACGRDLSAVNLATPCLCGSTARRRIDLDGAVFRRPLGAATPGWDPFKDWTVKYLQLTWNLAQLRRLYATGDDPQQLRGIVRSTFAACLSLGEWLAAGPEPAAVTPGDVARFVAAEPVSVCAALAAADGARARLLPVAFARPPRYWVEYEVPAAKPVRYDALDLAERCLLAWQEFLVDRDVALPNWQ